MAKNKQICYVLKFRDIDGQVFWKIGITTRRIGDRIAEIVMSMFQVLRYIPMTKAKKFSSSPGYEKIELAMHKKYKKNKYRMPDGISGKTEYFRFDTEEEELEMLDHYADLIEQYKTYVVPETKASATVCSIIGINYIEPKQI